MTKGWEMTDTMANGCSYDSTQQELSNEYQHDRVKMIFLFFPFLCVSEGLTLSA